MNFEEISDFNSGGAMNAGLQVVVSEVGLYRVTLELIQQSIKPGILFVFKRARGVMKNQPLLFNACQRLATENQCTNRDHGTGE